MHAKQRQIAAALREEAAMFGQVIAFHHDFPLLCGFFVETKTVFTNSALWRQ
jgi:hypothetical protein